MGIVAAGVMLQHMWAPFLELPEILVAEEEAGRGPVGRGLVGRGPVGRGGRGQRSCRQRSCRQRRKQAEVL